MVLVLAVLGAACGLGSTAPDRARPTPDGSIVWTDCGAGLRCSTLEVPIDHGDPTGPTIDLALAVRPAARAAERLGVLLTNPGGPGASGIGALRSGVPLPAAVLDRFDVVTWDPRGGGRSSAVRCGPTLGSFLALDPAPAADDRPDLDRLARATARACAEATGPLIDHMSTVDHVADMEAIRKAAGAPTVSYVGFSYGTRLGLEYLARHGDRVATMVLDGIVPPDVDGAELLAVQAGELERVVENVLRGDELTYDAVRQDAADRTEAEADDGLDPVRIDRALVLSGYDPALADQFTAALGEAARGDGRPLDELGRRYERLVDLPAYLATSCADAGAPTGEDGWDLLERRALRVGPLVGAVVANELRPCAFWPTGATGPDRAPPTETGADVVLLTNTVDPATPRRWARSVADDLPSATLVEIDGQGHIALDGSRCARELAGRALTRESRPHEPECR